LIKSETHHIIYGAPMGFAALNPSYDFAEFQKRAVTLSRAASGSTGCKIRSITPLRQTAAGGGVAELHCAKRASVLISDP
jgi:hypothetical protein